MRLMQCIAVLPLVILAACADLAIAATRHDTTRELVRPWGPTLTPESALRAPVSTQAHPFPGMSVARGPVSVQIDPLVLPAPVPTITLDIGHSYAGVTPMGMGFHPGFRQYYGAIGGNPSYSGFVWDAPGLLLQTRTPINVDVRGIYHNPNTNAIEVVSYGAAFGGGLYSMGLDGSGLYTGANTNVLTALPGLASDQTVPAYDPVRNRFYSRSLSATVNLVSRVTGNLLGQVTLDLAPAGFPSLLGETIGYDKDFDVLITVDLTNSRALVHRLNGSYLGACPLPPFVPTQNRFNMGYANGQLFVFDMPSNAWHGYRILTSGVITHTITASAGPHGAIDPSGVVAVADSASQSFTITPDPCYHIADVVVDGSSVGAIGTYTFHSVTANHTIVASFALDVETITASAGAHGAISPNGAVAVNCGANQTFAVTPDPGYLIADVLVDGASVGPVASHTFVNVITDHTIAASFVAINQPPDCRTAHAMPAVLWPPDHGLVPVTIAGITDPDRDPVTIVVTGITQDEPPDSPGDGNTCPDAVGDGSRVLLRAERSGTGNGRVYTVSFTASDGRGGSCAGSAKVCVPHDIGAAACVDDGPRYHSTGLCRGVDPSAADLPATGVNQVALTVGPRVGSTLSFHYSLPAEHQVQMAVYDIAGRRVATLLDGLQGKGVHELGWNPAELKGGMYFCRLRAGRVVITRPLVVVK